MGAHNEMILEGWADLAERLRELPAVFADRAGEIVMNHAEEARALMDAQYAQHEWTGRLRAGLTLLPAEQSRWGIRVVLKNTDNKAYWAEYGTKVRRTGAGVDRGAMSPLRIFIPIKLRTLRQLRDSLIRMVEGAGLTVRRAA